MTDRELLRKLMYEYDWNQGELAQRLGFHQANVSKVIKQKQQLSQERRRIAETLLDQRPKGDES